MAKQAGIIKVTGTVYNVCFYKLGSQYYARAKSSLTGKRVKKDPAFKKTMQNARLLAKASTIASSVYRKLLPNQRDRRLYQQLTGNAIRLLKQGLSESKVAIAITTNLYSGSTVLRKDTVKSSAHEESRVRKSDADTRVNDFILKDHRGNLRIVLPTGKKTGTYTAARVELADSTLDQTFYNHLPETRTTSPPSGYAGPHTCRQCQACQSGNISRHPKDRAGHYFESKARASI